MPKKEKTIEELAAAKIEENFKQNKVQSMVSLLEDEASEIGRHTFILLQLKDRKKAVNEAKDCNELQQIQRNY